MTKFLQRSRPLRFMKTLSTSLAVAGVAGNRPPEGRFHAAFQRGCNEAISLSGY